MRSLWIALILLCLVACGSPVGEEAETAEPEEAMAAAPGADADEEEGEEAEDEAPELPPEGALPLSIIIGGVESQGFGPIYEVEFEDGVWDVDCLKDGEAWELEIDPLSGQLLENAPDQD